ncbi:MAG: RecQ family ATP-dependent DNA helicase, partial [Solirubrobacteraceae bacterium]
ARRHALPRHGARAAFTPPPARRSDGSYSGPMPATPAIATRASELLHALAGPGAAFREHQLEAIADLVEDRARVLCVQRTGWGKSAVYFIATALLRSHPTHAAGPTLIVSPLLALMRNQIAAAQRLGIRAHTVNSTNRDAWEEISALLDADAVDLLLISPERLNNPQFRARMLPAFAARVGLLVVDEAHCISDWGHDFRPDYRRIADMLERLPAGVGVLCTTATANDRVVADIEDQLRTGHSGASLVAYRGPLGRSSLRFEVVELPGQADRLAWLATHLPELPGSGIVYTLTKRDAEQVAAWLNAHGVGAEAYTGEIETERRIAVEERLLANDLKCVVATSALGMGYDKPDLGFVVHYQAPGSVISYYQQVGRAGRAIERAEVVLLRGAEDRRIQDFFIEQAFPRRDLVERVLAHLDEVGSEGASTPELTALVNLGRGRIDAMLKVLDVEGAVSRDGSRWIREADSDWAYDSQRYEHITALRRREQATMASFGADGRCLMRALQEELDDPGPQDCGRCSVCTAPRYDGPLDPGLVREAIDHLRSQPLTLDAKKMAPDAGGRMRKIAAEVVVEEGRALARLGDGGWDPVLQAGLREGRLSEQLAEAADRLVRAWSPPVRWITSVPSARRPGVVEDLGRRLSLTLGIPYVALLERAAERPPQREMSNAALQAANVRGAFRVSGDPPPDAGLLLDDVRLSGWTLAMTGGQLRRCGAGPIFPLALATAF